MSLGELNRFSLARKNPPLQLRRTVLGWGRSCRKCLRAEHGMGRKPYIQSVFPHGTLTAPSEPESPMRSNYSGIGPRGRRRCTDKPSGANRKPNLDVYRDCPPSVAYKEL